MSGFTAGAVLAASDLNAALVMKRVRVATTVAGTLASSFENGDTVDGVVLATGDRILLKNQAAGATNGIYVVAASGAPTRAVDFDSSAEVLPNTMVVVSEGTTNADTVWQLTTDAPITLDTTALVFAQFGGLTTPAMVAIAESVLSGTAATIDFTSIPATYDHLKIIISARGDNGAANQRLKLRLNNDSGSNYSIQEFQAFGTTASANETLGTTALDVGNICTAGAVTQPGTSEILIPGYAGTTFKKHVQANALMSVNDSTANGRTIQLNSGLWFAAPAAINRVTLYPAAGNFVAGTVCTLYGLNGV